MAKFLNTSATNYFLEELIKNAKERLILISPYLKINERIKELIEDKNRLKIDVRVVYGKNELQPDEIKWLKELPYVRTSFCKNLHAKCYMNEEICIITSLNLYEFSQINNNEMGILIQRIKDQDLYKEAYDEAQRIIRISDEIRISVETIEKDSETEENEESKSNKITTSRLAKKLGLKTAELLQKFVDTGYLDPQGERFFLTQKGIDCGGEFRKSPRFGPYFIWPEDLLPEK
ncbi:MAG: phospholipase D family protein [Desulfobulbus sp.]